MPRSTIKLGELRRIFAQPRFKDDMEVWCASTCVVDGDEDVLHASVDEDNSVQVRDGRVVIWACGYSDDEIAKSEVD